MDDQTSVILAVAELAEALGTTPGRVVPILDRAEAAGLARTLPGAVAALSPAAVARLGLRRDESGRWLLDDAKARRGLALDGEGWFPEADPVDDGETPGGAPERAAVRPAATDAAGAGPARRKKDPSRPGKAKAPPARNSFSLAALKDRLGGAKFGG